MCTATLAYPAADLTQLLALNLRQGISIGDVTGSLVERPQNCTSSRQTACVVQDGFEARPLVATSLLGPADQGDGRDGDLVVPAGTTRELELCGEVTSLSATRLTSQGLRFKEGDLLLLHVTQDVFAASSETIPWSTSMPPGSAGTWQIVRVSDYALGEATFSPAPPAGLLAAAKRQVCYLPQFRNVTVPSTSTLKSSAWNGASGGILAFFVSGTLEVEGRVSANALGFRGALPAMRSSGARGEGSHVVGYGLISKAASAGGGGGGGPNTDSGGGGGANGGAGGFGGWHFDAPWDESRGGAPERFDFAVSERFTLGGGGGSGEQGEGFSKPAGAGGGGIMVFAASMRGGGQFQANGASVPDGGEDGNGGGGAGGTIWIMSDEASAFTGTISATGGDGGDVARGHGPGGGGGGGRVLLSTAVAAAPASPPALAGGRSGLSDVTAPPTGPRGATAGGAGVAESSIRSDLFP